MNREQKQFFVLLRAGLWDTPVDATLFSGRTDWDVLCVQAIRQTVSGLIAKAVSTLPAATQPPESIASQLRSTTIAIIRSHALLNRALAEIVTLFRQNGIRTVLFKGQGVATNYPEPTLRICGDIDLYVGQENYDKACELARQWGKQAEASTETEKHSLFKCGNAIVELHRIAERLPMPQHNARFQCWTRKHLHSDRLRGIEIEGTTILLPPVNFDALYIFNHSWHHFLEGGGVGLRQLCDWVRYLHTFRNELNRAELKQDLKAFGLWRPWRIFGSIAVDTLGLPPEEFPFYTNRYAKQAARVMRMIDEGGNFGFFYSSRLERPEGYIARKIHSLKQMNGRFLTLLSVSPKEVVIAWICFLYRGVKKVIKDQLTAKKQE